MPWGHAPSANAETFVGNFNTRDDAITSGRKWYMGEAFYIVEGTMPKASCFMPSATDILELVAVAAGDIGGEAAVDYPDISSDSGAFFELETFLAEWAEEHIPPDFWVADGVPERIEAKQSE